MNKKIQKKKTNIKSKAKNKKNLIKKSIEVKNKFKKLKIKNIKIKNKKNLIKKSIEVKNKFKKLKIRDLKIKKKDKKNLEHIKKRGLLNNPKAGKKIKQTYEHEEIVKVKEKIANLENKDLDTYILNLETKHKRGRKKKQNTSIPKQEEAEKTIDKLLNNANIVDYLIKNVSKRTPEVLTMLINPTSDEQIAFKLDMKINSIRRILNLLQGYGLTKYYVEKNINGWLSFAWYININKIDYFFEYVNQGSKNILKEECNDYFICNKCYKNNNLILTFSEAFEVSFKCSNCGKQYERIDKEHTQKLINEEK
ncbi:MAG: hypothetical protein M1168_00950 [Candidatus Marsarchaeota archaeon]|nr:hypothetical protein [Candidatus Marsarchaeota archaeon]MCL5094537.1 hypothetical protein [Candidatus Marsarchaeota archaeon]